MDNTTGNKRINTNSPTEISTFKHRKTKQNDSISPQKVSNYTKLSKEILNTSRDDRMNNIVKLRQQFIQEINDIVNSLTESKKNFKTKISEIKKKDDIIKRKLQEENKLLCNQSKVIYDKEQENKILRVKIEELYEYQKILFENLEDINTTINAHENLSDQLTNEYNSIVVMQQNDNKLLKEELNKIKPDEKHSEILNEINQKINELEKEKIQLQTEDITFNTEIKTEQKCKEEQQQKLKEIDKRINELETQKKIAKQNEDIEKSNLFKEMETLKQETNLRANEVTEIEKNISELEVKLNSMRNNCDMNEKKITEINDEIISLSEEKNKLDILHQKEDKNNTTNLEKLEEKLKTSESELTSINEKNNQAINILQKKISEIRIKLKNFEGIESKIRVHELEIKKEEEMGKQIVEECEKKKKLFNDQNKSIEEKNKIETKISQMENKISVSKEKIKSLEKELHKLNENYDFKSKEVKNKSKIIKNISQFNLPNLFASEELETGEKQKNRRKLYTPTFADDELEIDSMPIDEQFDHLTQSSPSSSQSGSPDKQKKFFKRSSSQPQLKKENTPRGKGRNKKY